MTTAGPFRGDAMKKAPPAAKALARDAAPYVTQMVMVAVPGEGPPRVHLLTYLEPAFPAPPDWPKRVPIRLMLPPKAARAAAEGILACLDSPEFKKLADPE